MPYHYVTKTRPVQKKIQQQREVFHWRDIVTYTPDRNVLSGQRIHTRKERVPPYSETYDTFINTTETYTELVWCDEDQPMNQTQTAISEQQSCNQSDERRDRDIRAAYKIAEAARLLKEDHLKLKLEFEREKEYLINDAKEKRRATEARAQAAINNPENGDMKLIDAQELLLRKLLKLFSLDFSAYTRVGRTTRTILSLKSAYQEASDSFKNCVFKVRDRFGTYYAAGGHYLLTKGNHTYRAYLEAKGNKEHYFSRGASAEVYLNAGGLARSCLEKIKEIAQTNCSTSFTSFWNKYVKGRDPLMENFYATLASMNVNNMDSLNATKESIEILFQQVLNANVAYHEEHSLLYDGYYHIMYDDLELQEEVEIELAKKLRNKKVSNLTMINGETLKSIHQKYSKSQEEDDENLRYVEALKNYREFRRN